MQNYWLARYGIRKYNSKRELIVKGFLSIYLNQSIVGEASTHYTLGDYSEKYSIQVKIKNANPKMKLVYILRNPYDRIVSLFLMCKSKGCIDSNLDDFVNDQVKDFHNTSFYALKTSQYGNQMMSYTKHFSLSQIKVITIEELNLNPIETMNSIFEFLGLVKHTMNKNEYTVYNESKNRLFFNKEELKFSHNTFQKLSHFISEDMLVLKNLTKRDFSEWNLNSEYWVNENLV